MKHATDLQNRWLRVQRHLRSCTTNPRVARQADRAAAGDFAFSRRLLCGRHRGASARVAG
jgi:hypothetical protein